MYRKSVLIFAITCLVALAFGQFTTPRASAGGIYISASAILTTTNVTFAANHAAGMQGSALYNAGIT